MLVDQASALRQWAMESDGRRARCVAVASGKGGVGKSSVAVNLAVRLSAMGRRVVLIDADLGTANADLLCNSFASSNIAHVVAGRRTLAQAMVDAPGGFRLIAGASGLAQVADLSEFERARLIQQMSELEHDADMILVDTGAGISSNVLGFAVNADQLLVVTTPEPTAITDAYALIKTVHRQRAECDISILVNMVQSESQGREVFDRLSAVSQRFLDLHVNYAGHIKRDERVSLGVLRRRPFVLDSPQCDASVCIGRLAHRLDRHAAEPRGDGLFRRMANWLVG